MGFSRIFKPEDHLTGQELNQALVGIGFLLSSKAKKNINIEHCLISLLQEAFLDKQAYDLRLLGLFVNWCEVHLSQVNANRFIKLINGLEDSQVLRFVAAVFELIGDSRFKKFVDKNSTKRRVYFLRESEFLVKRNGEDSRFKNTKLIIHSRALPNRLDLILTPEILSQKHLYYRYRVLLGPTYRADVIANLSVDKNLSPSDLARNHFTNYQTSYKAKKDFQLFSILKGD